MIRKIFFIGFSIVLISISSTIGVLYLNDATSKLDGTNTDIKSRLFKLSDKEKVTRIERYSYNEYNVYTIDTLTGMSQVYSYNAGNNTFSLIIKID